LSRFFLSAIAPAFELRYGLGCRRITCVCACQAALDTSVLCTGHPGVLQTVSCVYVLVLVTLAGLPTSTSGLLESDNPVVWPPAPPYARGRCLQSYGERAATGRLLVAFLTQRSHSAARGFVARSPLSDCCPGEGKGYRANDQCNRKKCWTRDISKWSGHEDLPVHNEGGRVISSWKCRVVVYRASEYSLLRCQLHVSRVLSLRFIPMKKSCIGLVCCWLCVAA
jgi:hypothetical protein